jgi:hypothetical protein
MALQPQTPMSVSRSTSSVNHATARIAVRYARNDDAASLTTLKSSEEITQKILSAPAERIMQPSALNLKRFGETVQIAGHHLTMYAVDSNRMVYEVTATFSSTYHFSGMTYLSGSKTYVVDAQTGDVLYATVSGNQVPTKPLAKCTQGVCFSTN